MDTVDLERKRLHLSNGTSVPLPHAAQQAQRALGDHPASASTQPHSHAGHAGAQSARPAGTAYHSAVTSPSSSRHALWSQIWSLTLVLFSTAWAPPWSVQLCRSSCMMPSSGMVLHLRPARMVCAAATLPALLAGVGTRLAVPLCGGRMVFWTVHANVSPCAQHTNYITSCLPCGRISRAAQFQLQPCCNGRLMAKPVLQVLLPLLQSTRQLLSCPAMGWKPKLVCPQACQL